MPDYGWLTALKKISPNVLIGALAPLIAVGMAVVLLGRTLTVADIVKTFTGYPWRMFFAFGILSSLWVQFAVTLYFRDNEYFESTRLRRRIDILNNFIPFLMIGSVLVSLVRIDSYVYHIVFTLLYMFLASFWDWSIWRLSTPVDGKELQHEKFKKCCGQLLWHVDGVVFFIILFWVVVFFFFVGRQHFTSLTDITAYLSTHPQNCVSDLDTLLKYELQEPLMGGAIGFHTVLSVVLLLIHLVEWENAKDHA